MEDPKLIKDNIKMLENNVEKIKLKILVTGSAGFIGTHLMEALQKTGKYQILGLDKKLSSAADLTDYKSVVGLINNLLGKPDVIIHLAATCSTQASIDNPSQDFNDNVIASFNTFQIAKASSAKVIYTSSCKSIANSEGVRTPYGLGKYTAELYLQEWGKDFGVEYVINRPGTIYGPGQEGSPESGWLAWFIKAAREKLPITIFGDGSQKRDILWVNDYVRLLMDQLENFDKYKGEVYDVGGGEENVYSIKHVLDNILNYKNYNFGPARIGDAKEYIEDNSKVSAVNGWKPLMAKQDGIKLTVNSLKKGK